MIVGAARAHVGVLTDADSGELPMAQGDPDGQAERSREGACIVVPTNDAIRGQPGDIVIVEGHRVGELRRIGEILEALGTPGHEHYRVRWDDGRETVFYPSSDATIRAGTRTRRTKTR